MNRFLKGAMILTLAGIIVKVIGAFSKVLIARISGGEGIGVYMMDAKKTPGPVPRRRTCRPGRGTDHPLLHHMP